MIARDHQHLHARVRKVFHRFSRLFAEFVAQNGKAEKHRVFGQIIPNVFRTLRFGESERQHPSATAGLFAQTRFQHGAIDFFRLFAVEIIRATRKYDLRRALKKDQSSLFTLSAVFSHTPRDGGFQRSGSEFFLGGKFFPRTNADFFVAARFPERIFGKRERRAKRAIGSVASFRRSVCVRFIRFASRNEIVFPVFTIIHADAPVVFYFFVGERFAAAVEISAGGERGKERGRQR